MLSLTVTETMKGIPSSSFVYKRKFPTPWTMISNISASRWNRIALLDYEHHPNSPEIKTSVQSAADDR
jgi:hypothetical protein